MEPNLIFYQLFEHESSTYTYLLADALSKEAVIIDSVLETVERDMKLVEELGLKIKYVLDTHVHADHITGAGEIRKRTGAKTGVSAGAQVSCVDLALEDGEELEFGKFKVKALATPGHTDSCMSFLCGNRVFSGDTLLIRGTGRTDFQQGSSAKLFDSIRSKLFTLPDETHVYPGHDYRGQTASTIGLEKKYNPRIAMTKSKDDFIKIMSELKLANPKKIHEAVPANLGCGIVVPKRNVSAIINDGIPEVTVHAVSETLGKVRLIDVRRPDEFNGELGHIKGAELITLGPDLTRFLETAKKDEEIIFVCRSGGRSGQATADSIKYGFKATANMIGGMILWNESRLPIERNG